MAIFFNLLWVLLWSALSFSALWIATTPFETMVTGFLVIIVNVQIIAATFKSSEQPHPTNLEEVYGMWMFSPLIIIIMALVFMTREALRFWGLIG